MSGHRRGPPPQYPASSHNSKVAIPRLDPNRPGAQPPNEKSRTTKACSSCRLRKVKCSGDNPRCKTCEAHDIPCVYPQARRDRLKTATETNHELIQLLKDVSIRVDDGGVRKRIKDVLEQVNEENLAPTSASSPKAPSLKRQRYESPADEDDAGEAHVGASVGSNEETDLIDEDLHRDSESRATGFLGRNSEVQWLRSLKNKVDDPNDPSRGVYGPPGTGPEAAARRGDAFQSRQNIPGKDLRHVTSSTFYLDDSSVDVETTVDPYELPAPEVSEKLFSCFMGTIHPSFPIIPTSMENQFHRFNQSIRQGRPLDVPDRWRAVLNLVLAIGAQYSHFIGAKWRGHPNDHLLYQARARRLGLRGTDLLVTPPDIWLIYMTGLLSVYYMVIGHVSRSWVVAGISIRFAQALGLHLRNEVSTTSVQKKEILMLTWWGLYALERLLSAVTGRPSVISDTDCSVPLPTALKSGSPSEHSSTATPFSKAADTTIGTVAPPHSMMYLEARIKMDAITQKALKLLYAASSASHSWQYVQKTIKTLLNEIDDWVLSIPEDPATINIALRREKLLLEFGFNATKILITRPCLCRLERRIERQSDDSSKFNTRTAETCVQAAKALTLLLPNTPDPPWIYESGPWWSIVHHVMQAYTVFLLEVAYGSVHITKDGVQLVENIKKLVRWLRAMKYNNAVAERAYGIALDILKAAAPKSSIDIQDLLQEHAQDEDPVPPQPKSTGSSTADAFAREGQFPATMPMGLDGLDETIGREWSSADFSPYIFLDGPNVPTIYNPFHTTFDEFNPILPPMNNPYEYFEMGRDPALLDPLDPLLQTGQQYGEQYGNQYEEQSFPFR